MSRARGAGRTDRLQVSVTDGRGRSLPMARSLGRWLAQHAPRRARGTVAVALVTDARMRLLNKAFRGMDGATDVLSFPNAEGAGLEAPTFRSARAAGLTADAKAMAVRRSLARRRKTGRSTRRAPRPKPQGSNHLGDLAIARGVATRQAWAEGHDLATELRILALHGLLHLLGYDHERDRGTMRTVEDRLRRRAGLPAGLITRAPKRPLLR